MITRIVVSRNAERGFRKRALAALPNEYVEILLGFVHKHTAYVCGFLPVPLKCDATPYMIDYEEEDIPDIVKGIDAKMISLGTIHSHPDRAETLFSEQDLRGCIVDCPDDLVMAICAIEFPGEKNKLKRRKCRVAYWPAPHPLHLHYR